MVMKYMIHKDWFELTIGSKKKKDKKSRKKAVTIWKIRKKYSKEIFKINLLIAKQLLELDQ